MSENGQFAETGEKSCATCRYWEHGDPYRCMNRDGVFYGDLMGPEEKCEEWEEDGNVNVNRRESDRKDG